jgi:hypothetical protein
LEIHRRIGVNHLVLGIPAGLDCSLTADFRADARAGLSHIRDHHACALTARADRLRDQLFSCLREFDG